MYVEIKNGYRIQLLFCILTPYLIIFKQCSQFFSRTKNTRSIFNSFFSNLNFKIVIIAMLHLLIFVQSIF